MARTAGAQTIVDVQEIRCEKKCSLAGDPAPARQQRSYHSGANWLPQSKRASFHRLFHGYS